MSQFNRKCEVPSVELRVRSESAPESRPGRYRVFGTHGSGPVTDYLRPLPWREVKTGQTVSLNVRKLWVVYLSKELFFYK